MFMQAERSLLRAPVFSLAVTTIFAVVTATLAASAALVWHIAVKPLPFPESSRLALIWNRYGAEKPSSASLSAPEPQVYMSLLQRREREMYGVVRVDGNPDRVIPEIRALVRSLDRTLPLAATRWIRSFLFGVDSVQTALCIAAALAFALVAALAGITPVFRAASIDPATALRHE